MVIFRILTLLFMFFWAQHAVHAQPARSQDPIVLEWADSLVGTGATDVGIKEFAGHVRFRQGDVTVTCDRALHDAARNHADLFGNVVVTQGGLRMTAPRASFDGERHLASGSGGVRLVDGHRRLTARSGTYETTERVARFRDSVRMQNDTLTVWSDRAIYWKSTGESMASGRVVARDSVRNAVVRGDSMYHDPRSDAVRIAGSAGVWTWDAAVAEGDTAAEPPDTLYLAADTIDVLHQPEERYIAVGDVTVVRGLVAAQADSMDHVLSEGTFELFGSPIVWADGSQLRADTILVDAPERVLRSITGVARAILVSRSDSLRPDRYDQISGSVLVLRIEADTLRSLLAYDQAQSITWRVEDDRPEGLAKFASDSIKAEFAEGTVQDVYWLRGVAGEHHPENVVSGREAQYLLRGFSWEVIQPKRPEMPVPFGTSPTRPARAGRRDPEVGNPGPIKNE